MTNISPQWLNIPLFQSIYSSYYHLNYVLVKQFPMVTRREKPLAVRTNSLLWSHFYRGRSLIEFQRTSKMRFYRTYAALTVKMWRLDCVPVFCSRYDFFIVRNPKEICFSLFGITFLNSRVHIFSNECY